MNLLLRTLLPKGCVLTTEIEHPSVHNTLRAIKSKEELEIVQAGKEGQPVLSAIEAAITEKTRSLVFSAVNSETGALLDLEGVASLARKYNLVLIIDGVALLGKKAFSLPEGVAAMGFSAHKIHGPQGAGFCFIKEGSITYSPFQTGGPQEMQKRAGTENLLAILGMASAIKALKEKDPAYLEILRDTFEKKVLEKIPFAFKNIEGPRISNTSNLYFEGIDAESLLILLDQQGVMASYGSACSSGALEPSRVLLGMGYPKKRATSSIRFSFHYQNTLEEIEKAADILYQCCTILK